MIPMVAAATAIRKPILWVVRLRSPDSSLAMWLPPSTPSRGRVLPVARRRGTQLGDLGGQLGDLALEALEARVVRGGGRRRGGLGERRRGGSGCGAGRLVEVLAQAMRVAILLLARAARVARDEPALHQAAERRLERGLVRERVEPLDALAQLARRLGPAQHQHRQ